MCISLGRVGKVRKFNGMAFIIQKIPFFWIRTRPGKIIMTDGVREWKQHNKTQFVIEFYLSYFFLWLDLLFFYTPAKVS